VGAVEHEGDAAVGILGPRTWGRAQAAVGVEPRSNDGEGKGAVAAAHETHREEGHKNQEFVMEAEQGWQDGWLAGGGRVEPHGAMDGRALHGGRGLRAQIAVVEAQIVGADAW
jgi:hypothetical protein